jgi:glutamate synthase domain-containing protein 1
MCGIAGVVHRNGTFPIGREITDMLQAMKHRGPDSTGYAFYGPPQENSYVVRFGVAEREEAARGFDIRRLMVERHGEVDARLSKMEAQVLDRQQPTDFAFRYVVTYDGDWRELANYVEDIEGVEIHSIGRSLELIKDLGDANQVTKEYSLGEFVGSHAIGHVRMATESDVDIRSAHPYWAYPFSDVSIVHNGQLTNFWKMRRRLERKGHRFVSNNDSEVIAVYVADKINSGASLEEAMRDSLEEMDGVFTYIVATRDQLGMAKDVMAAKPMVVYESDDLIALASEEVAIRSIFPHEIYTRDPYEGEVLVWQV